MDNNTSTSDHKSDSGQDSFGKPDTEYYFSIVVIKVENTIFRVPRNGFDVPGTIFADMFSLPVTPGSNAEGSSDRNPIVLPVSEEYFRGFLRAMYAINGRQMSETDWLGALDLSTMWRFSEMRTRAIRALDDWIPKQDPKEAALLAKKYHVANWLIDAYTRLLQQQTFTASELNASPFSLDWETIARLFSVREAFHLTNQYGSSQPDRAVCSVCRRSTSARFYNKRGGGSFHERSDTDRADVKSPTAESLVIAIENEFQRELAGTYSSS